MSSVLNNIQELNISVFNFFNQIFGKARFDSLMIFADKFGGPHVFHYHFLLIMTMAAIMLYHKKDNRSDLKELTILGSTAICTLFFSIIINLVLITDLLKDYTTSNRPYCELKDVYIVSEVIKYSTCNRGFPSGHMTFSIIMATSFWSLFNRFFKIIATITLIIIAISRMSSGAHYPIDLLGAIIICLPITIYIKGNVEYLIRLYEKRWDAFEYLYSKIIR